MKIRELINLIEKDFPINSAMSFDNSGANIVDYNADLSGIVVCLDVTIATIEFAKQNGANLIISHHPLIFNEIRNINDDPISKRIKLLNKYEISAYSSHTNFDSNLKRGMGISLINKLFDKSLINSHKILESYTIDGTDYGIGDITIFNKNLNFDEILTIIKSKLELSNDKISYYKVNDNISKIILIPGSGSSEIDLVIAEKPDLLITSDLKHNQILDLTEEGISYINASHYGLEKIFIESFSDYLANDLKINNIYTFYLNLL